MRITDRKVKRKAMPIKTIDKITVSYRKENSKKLSKTNTLIKTTVDFKIKNTKLLTFFGASYFFKALIILSHF